MIRPHLRVCRSSVAGVCDPGIQRREAQTGLTEAGYRRGRSRPASQRPATGAGFWTLLVVLLGLAPRPSSAQFTNPASGELLGQLPYDYLTLIDNERLKIEPISPRPLPPLGAGRTRREETFGPRNNVGSFKSSQTQPGMDSGSKKKDGRDRDVFIIHLTEGDVRDFKVKRSSIKTVEYWEDMLLAEGERLAASRDFAKAFEYYLAVQARNPRWKGLSEHVDQLLFQEGSWALSGNERDKGIRLLTELYHRRPDYPGLARTLAKALGNRVEEAVSNQAYAYGRKVLHELEGIAPDDSLVRTLSNRFEARARDIADRGEKAKGAERLDAYAEALRIWPKLEGVAGPYAKEFRALPTLDVGVLDVPRPVAPWGLSPASDRVNPLLYRPILADESDEAMLGRKASQVASSLEIRDLGRRLEIRLKGGIRWSDDSRRLSVIDVVRTLSDRAQPRSPSFSARWADLLDRIETADVDSVTVWLTRSPVSPPYWLLLPVGPAHASWDGRVSTPEGRLPVGDGLYFVESESEGTLTLLARDGGKAASLGQPASGPSGDSNPEASAPASSNGVTSALPSPKILRIKETRFASGDDAMLALERGEVSLLEHVPADRVPSLALMEGIKTGHYRLPSLHCLAIDGRNPSLQSRSLRRAIAYAIDRQALLEEKVLKRPIDEINRPSDGVFAQDSYANAPGVKPLEYNLMLSKMLVAAARRELSQGQFKFTLEYPSVPEAAVASQEIAEMLKNVGIEIELKERPPSELEQSLRIGRRFDLAYRIARCSEPVYQAGPMLCPGYDAPPGSAGLASVASPRIIQLLLELEHAPEWGSARELVTRIDREVRDELPIIPLWQVQDHYAWRDRLSGPPEEAGALYQNIGNWEIEPWFARDPW